MLTKLTVAAAAFAALVLGCGDGGAPTKTGGPTAAPAAPVVTEKSAAPAAPAASEETAAVKKPEGKRETGGAKEAYPKDKFKGSIKGVVSWEGDAPKRPLIDMGADKACAAKHDEKNQLRKEEIVVNNGKLKNVIVYAKTGPHTKFSYDTPAKGVVIDQQGCQYTPHVVGLMVDQPLTFRNSDGFAHNVHGISKPNINEHFNLSQNAAGQENSKKLSEPELPYNVQCDIHKWMSAYVGVFDHPFFAVTGDDGAFEITGLPPGDYEIEAWQESAKANGPQTAKVTVADGAKEQNFTFKLK